MCIRDRSMSPWGCGCNDAINWSRKRAHYFVPIEAEPKKIKVSKSKMTKKQMDEYEAGFMYGKVQRGKKK